MVNDAELMAQRKRAFAKLVPKLCLEESESWLRGSLELAILNGRKRLACSLLEQAYMQLEDVRGPLAKWNREKPALDALKRGSLKDFCRQLGICENTMHNVIKRKLRALPEFGNFAADASGFRQLYAVCRLIWQAEMEAKLRFREVLRSGMNGNVGATIHSKPRPRKLSNMG